MRPHIVEFVAEAVRRLEPTGPVLEVGARAAEGQAELANLRPLFAGQRYVGTDLQPGTGVDCVTDTQNLAFADGTFGTVLALDTLEHVADPLRAVADMCRVLRPGGVLLASSVMFFPIHEHPWDYWRFTPEGFELLLRPFDDRLVLALGWDLMPETVMGVGRRAPLPEGGPLRPDHLPETAERCARWAEGIPVDLGPIRMGVRQLWRMTLRESVALVRRRLPPAVRR